MTLDIQRAASRRMRRIVAGLVGLVVVLVGVIVGLTLGGGNSPSATPAAPGPSASPGQQGPTPMPSETAGGAYVAPATWVRLPKGGQPRDGLEAGFPHTVEGAAAAAVASVRGAWTWDADAAEKAAGVYALPAEADKTKAAARQAVAASRASAGVPGTGPLPEGAHMSVAPIGVQWSGATADQVTVSVLTRIVYTPGGGTAEKTQVLAMPATMVWADGDWHSKTSAPVKAPEPFDLGTEGFNSAGWRAIQEGDQR
uniref:hypothetical protein n=1 Tax=unclassified Streptomyces TaxID=2593676 RepID=UPI003F494A8F